MPPNANPTSVFPAARHSSPVRAHDFATGTPGSSAGSMHSSVIWASTHWRTTRVTPQQSPDVFRFPHKFPMEYISHAERNRHAPSSVPSCARAGVAGIREPLSGTGADCAARPPQSGAPSGGIGGALGGSAHSPVTDTLLALVILNLVAVAAWALVAFPMLREIAWGSVTALPWWVWAGFAVVMGAIAGGRVR